MKNFDDCPDVLRDFLMHMETIRNLSSRTIDGYYIDLRNFFRFLKQHSGMCAPDIEFHEIPISDIDIEMLKDVKTKDVYEYLHFVMRECNNNPNTRARKVSSLRSFFKYLTVKTHKLESDPVKDLEVPSLRKSLPKFLNLEESRELLRSTDGDFALRDFCIVTLFLNCGMRLSELCGINDNDVRDDTIRLLGKGNKERIVYINDACLAAIKNYRSVRDSVKYKNRDPKALFLSRIGTRLTPRRVEQIVAETLERAGLSGRGYSPHKLRHTAATLMYRYGNVDMLALKEILGHEHVSTTEIYTHISDESLKKAAKSNPLSEETYKPKK